MREEKPLAIPGLDETVYRYRSDCGLQIHIMEKKGFSKKYAFFGTRYGSIDNRFVADGRLHAMPAGIAHFLEHKLFEEENGDVFEVFSEAGARANAFTSHESTNFLFTCTERFYENLETLMGFVQTLHIDSKSVEKERGIIEQEIMMYEDNPEWQAYLQVLALLYENHPVRIDIAGTCGSIRDITVETLDLCYRTFYSPENMIVFILGDVDRHKAVETVEASLTTDFKSRRPLIERKVEADPGLPKTEIHRTAHAVARPLFYMGIKCDAEETGEVETIRREIFIDLLLEFMLGKGSDLYRSLYVQGLISKNFGYDYNHGPAYGHIIIGGESKAPEKTYETLKKAFSSEGMPHASQSDFNRIKRKLTGESLVYMNSLDYIANAYVSAHHKGIGFFKYFSELSSFDYDMYREWEKRFETEGRTVLSVVHPESGEGAK